MFWHFLDTTLQRAFYCVSRFVSENNRDKFVRYRVQIPRMKPCSLSRGRVWHICTECRPNRPNAEARVMFDMKADLRTVRHFYAISETQSRSTVLGHITDIPNKTVQSTSFVQVTDRKSNCPSFESFCVAAIVYLHVASFNHPTHVHASAYRY